MSIKPKDKVVCKLMLGKMLTVRIKERDVVKAVVTECEVARYEGKKPVWALTLQRSEKYTHKYETRELQKYIDGEVDEVLATSYRSPVFEVEVATYSPSFEGGPRVNCW